MSDQRGDWIQTSLGGRMYPLDPRAEEIHLADIAHALSLICRFGGMTRRFYSVAQHSVLVSAQVPPEYALAGLLHDAAEAYVGDMVRPLKHAVEMEAYRQVEFHVERCVEERFGLEPCAIDASVIKRADRRLCATEARDLMAREYAEGWASVEPYPDRIIPEPPELAEQRFLARHKQLTRQEH